MTAYDIEREETIDSAIIAPFLWLALFGLSMALVFFYFKVIE
jgi:hypothetical protein